ncbi:MAG: acetate--CoA ligase family protein, partial [Hyphomicrobiaceae bacterium]
GLIAAGQTIKRNVEAHTPGISVDTILVEAMFKGLQEVLVGYRLDQQVGPVVTVAPGGIHVGIYDDKAVRLAPVDRDTAQEMIAEVTGFEPLRGHRNLPRGDLDGLADIIVAMSRLAGRSDVLVVEAEANPVIVDRDSAVAVDAFVRTAAVA